MPVRFDGSSARIIGATIVVAAMLAACTPGGQFDPTEVVTIDTKKKLQGEREPLFPAGVPGAQTGVPADLVKGYQAPPEPAPEAATAPPPPAAQAAAKPKPKPKPKPKVVRATPPPPAQASDPIWDRKPIQPAPGRDPIWDQKPVQPVQPSWPSPSQGAPAQQSAQPPPAWPNPPASSQSSR